MTDRLMTLPTVVIKQKAKLIELSNEYKIHSEDGEEIGAVRQHGQSGLRKMLRFVSNIDPMLHTALTVTDDTGAEVVRLDKPGHFWKAKVHLLDGTGRPLATIAQGKVIGKIRFDITDPNGAPIATLQGENWRAWNFTLRDAQGQEWAKVDKQWAGVGKELFTTADHYRISLSTSLSPDQRKIALAAGISVDTVLKQRQA